MINCKLRNEIMNEERAYSYFLTAFVHILNNKYSAFEIAIAADVSEAYISQIKNKKRHAGFKGQVKIAEACGYDYLDFLQLGQKLIEGSAETPVPEKDNRKKPPVGNVIRVYNNIMKKTGIELDAEGQEKLFNLIRRKLEENAAKEVENEFFDIASIWNQKAK